MRIGTKLLLKKVKVKKNKVYYCEICGNEGAHYKYCLDCKVLILEGHSRKKTVEQIKMENLKRET